MALQDMSAADLAAVVGNEDGGFGNGNGWWIILLFLFLGWGNRGWGDGSSAGNANGDMLYPWMNQAQGMWNGFSQVQQDLCSGFANAETAATARQMTSMQQQFALSQQFSDCCCENRLGLANLGADIAREACADRAAVSDGVRDILANQNASVQRILDQMCADKIDAKNEEIANLRQQLQMKDLAASQGAQTAQILADNARQTTALEQYLNPTPIPSYSVPNPNCCFNAGCGCGSF